MSDLQDQIKPMEIGRITVTLFLDRDGDQLVNVGVDTDNVPYLTAHGMLSMATEMLPTEYGIRNLDDDEEDDDA